MPSAGLGESLGSEGTGPHVLIPESRFIEKKSGSSPRPLEFTDGSWELQVSRREFARGLRTKVGSLTEDPPQHTGPEVAGAVPQDRGVIRRASASGAQQVLGKNRKRGSLSPPSVRGSKGAAERHRHCRVTATTVELILHPASDSCTFVKYNFYFWWIQRTIAVYMQLPKCSNVIKHTMLVLSKLWERLTLCKFCSSVLLKVSADILRFIAKYI